MIKPEDDPHNSYGMLEGEDAYFSGGIFKVIDFFQKPHPIFKGLMISAAIGCILGMVSALGFIIWCAY